MNVWHLAADTPRHPRRVTPGRLLNLAIGTWPIEAGPDVVVEFTVTAQEGQTGDGRTRASWVANRGANSCWAAVIGPFRDGDHVRTPLAWVGSLRGPWPFAVRTPAALELPRFAADRSSPWR